MKKIILTILFLFGFFLSPVIHAQETEHIQTYDVTMTVRADGSTGVSERITYFFDTPRHGIYRNIPFIKTNADGKKYAMTLTDVSVTDGQGQPYPYTQFLTRLPAPLLIFPVTMNYIGMPSGPVGKCRSLKLPQP